MSNEMKEGLSVPNEKNPIVDAYISNAKQWREEFTLLRNIVLECPLTEEFKWRVPCYTVDGGNVVMIHGFKEYCAILFVKGSLLKDPNIILVQQTANVQAARQVRFKNSSEIEALAPVLKEYIMQAIEIEKSGAAVDYKKNTDYSIPDELQNKFDEIPELSTAFHALTPGRQRAYILHFSEPKQAKTREARIEKSLKQILDGKGLND
jgi:uncharacterized protein YdeI (YjbR/CyaY-like superfamily)